MQYVEKVRNYTGTMPLREAVERSVEECIKEDILVSFFRRNRAEAIHVSITQYNQEAHMARIAETNRRQGRKEGREAERECINQLNEKLLADERIEDLRRSARTQKGLSGNSDFHPLNIKKVTSSINRTFKVSLTHQRMFLFIFNHHFRAHEINVTRNFVRIFF